MSELDLYPFILPAVTTLWTRHGKTAQEDVTLCQEAMLAFAVRLVTTTMQQERQRQREERQRQRAQLMQLFDKVRKRALDRLQTSETPGEML